MCILSLAWSFLTSPTLQVGRNKDFTYLKNSRKVSLKHKTLIFKSNLTYTFKLVTNKTVQAVFTTFWRRPNGVQCTLGMPSRYRTGCPTINRSNFSQASSTICSSVLPNPIFCCCLILIELNVNFVCIKLQKRYTNNMPTVSNSIKKKTVFFLCRMMTWILLLRHEEIIPRVIQYLRGHNFALLDFLDYPETFWTT